VPEKLYVDTFHPDALEEMLKIEYFYARKSRLLANDFYDDVVKAIEFLRLFAEAGQLIHHAGVRKTKPKRFPYKLIYAVEDDRVYVVAIAHLSSEPLQWLERLGLEEE
jgi:plasmid stabilization system protein ParE